MEVNKRAKDFKTPKRNKVDQAVGVSDFKRYKSLFSSNTHFEEGSFQQYAKHLDSSVEIVFEELEKSRKVQDFLENLVHNSTKSVEVKLHNLRDLIGRKPAQLQDKLDTPDLWGTMGEVASQMEEQKTKDRINLKNTVNKLSKKLILT